MAELDLKRVGASDVPSILGLAKYPTPAQIYARILGLPLRSPPQWVQDAAEAGKALEPALLLWASKQLGASPEDISQPGSWLAEDWGRSTVDALLWGRRIVEAKLRNRYSYESQDWSDETPAPSVYAQVHMQWACGQENGADLDKTAHVVLVCDQKLRLYTFDVDEALAMAIYGQTKDWYTRYVVEEVCPPLTEGDSPPVRKPAPLSRQVKDHEVELLEKLDEVRTRKREAEKEERTLIAQVATVFGDFSRLETPDGAWSQRVEDGRPNLAQALKEAVPNQIQRERLLARHAGEPFRVIRKLKS